MNRYDLNELELKKLFIYLSFFIEQETFEAINTLPIQLVNSADSLKIRHGFSLANALLIYPSLSNCTPLPLQACLVIKDPASFICLNMQRNFSEWLITDLLRKNQVAPKK